MQYGTGPTTVQVDYALLVHSQCAGIIFSSDAPLRSALSERAIIPLPEAITPPQQ